MKRLLLIFLLTFSNHSMAEWIEYSTGANGDIFFFDNSRLQKEGNHIRVWNRIRYKTSVMGASSYQSMLKIDCAEHTEATLQSTFYSDVEWAIPAMATNTREKPKKQINAGSATDRLANILCKE